MPNPYHDENGRFCSAGEMVSSVSRLILENRIREAETLLKEYKQITEKETIVGLTTHDLEKNDLATKIGSFYDSKKTIENYVVMTQDWSEVDIVAAEQTALIKTQRASKDLEVLEKEISTLQNNFAGRAGMPLSEFHTQIYTLKSEGEEVLNTVVDKAVAAGAPKLYTQDFVFNRVAPKAGIKDGFNSFQNKRIIAEPVQSPINKLPGIRDASRKEAIYAAFEQVMKPGELGDNWNKKTKQLSPLIKASDETTEALRKLYAETKEKKKTIEDQQKAIDFLKKLKTWRTAVSEAGVPTAGKLTSTESLKSSSIKLNDKGEIINVWGVENGKVDKIVAVERIESMNNVAQLVGESGKKYYSSTHYANRSSYQTTSHVIVDPNANGESLDATLGTSHVFNYSIDSGD